LFGSQAAALIASTSAEEASRMRFIPWLAAILIGSAALGVGCAVGFGFVTGANLELEALFLLGMQTALIAFVGSMALLIARWRD
jgi:hypothetical protein